MKKYKLLNGCWMLELHQLLLAYETSEILNLPSALKQYIFDTTDTKISNIIKKKGVS